MKYPDIYSYVKSEELAFNSDWQVTDNWFWNFKKHINWSILFKYGKFPISPNDFTRAMKNIVLPILNIQYRAEDIDLKDVNIWVDDGERYHLSFLVKKYHDEVYAPEHHLDTLFDELKEEKIDFGGVLVRKAKDGWVWEELDSIVFCDRNDFLGGPICFKKEYNFEELYEKEKQGWGKVGADITISDLISLAEIENDKAVKKGVPQSDKIEIYRLHGSLPSQWLNDKAEEPYIRQMQVLAFYRSAEGKAIGVTLYKNKEVKNPFKVHLRGKKIKNRPLGFGGVEELFDPQIWTNFGEIVKHNFLKAASKIVLYTDDETFANTNDVKNQDNLALNYIQPGKQIGQVPTTPVNMRLFSDWVNEMEQHAQRLGAATDPLMGEQSFAAIPFKAQQLQVTQGLGTHEYRKGKYCAFLQELYSDEDGILKDIKREITNGAKFLATLSADELEYVSDCLVKNEANKYVKEKILNGELVMPDEVEAYKQKVRDEFGAKGSRHFLEILKGEFDEAPLKVKVTIGNKGKDLLAITDKLTNIWREVLANPAILDDPRAAKVFGKILQYSNLDPIDFGLAKSKPQMPQMQQMPNQMPNQMMNKMPKEMPAYA